MIPEEVTMRNLGRSAPPILSVALIVVSAWVMAAEDAEEAHPDVDLNTPCDVCHAEMTPQVVEHWFAGPHGTFSVKCFVCHGSIGEDFKMVPDAMRCVGCHAEQVATMDDPSMSGGTCFDCHHPHRLNPHLAVPSRDEGGSK
jgi:hypothetical protein